MVNTWVILIITLLLYLLVVFTLRLIWKRLIKSKQHRQTATFLSALLSIPVILYLAFYLFLFNVSYYPENKFDPNYWEQDIEGRYKMTHFLIDHNVLIGRTKEEIKEMLGTKGLQEKDNIWQYDIGTVPGFGNIDPSFLYIEFEKDRVKHVNQHES